MKFLSTTVSLALMSSAVDAFVVPSPSFAQSSALRMSNEFDHLLGEGTQSAAAAMSSTTNALSRNNINANNIISLPDSSAAATATLTSSVSFEQVAGDSAAAADDLYSDAVGDEGAATGQAVEEQVTSDPRIAEIIRKEQQKQAMKAEPPTQRPPLSVSVLNFLKGKDFGEIFFTVLVPVIGGFYFSKVAYGKLSVQMEEKGDETLENYANEMIYHDGDFEEMKMAHNDYVKKLMYMGPKRRDTMIKRYLEMYAKKKTVSPQAISSLSYVFSIYKLTEEEAADILCDLCTSSMSDKMSSNGKLYFFGQHILKTPEAKAKLQPIMDLLASLYDDGAISGEEIVEKSQIAMGEAAYRASVASAGKKQTELTIGWEVLGLDEETAIKIFEEVAGEGFITQREAKYASKRQKFNAKGQKVEEGGDLKNPEEAEEEDDDDSMPAASGNVQECTNCGFTLFVAEGRDFKFFNAGFTCPECGASKDKFKPASMD